MESEIPINYLILEHLVCVKENKENTLKDEKTVVRMFKSGETKTCVSSFA